MLTIQGLLRQHGRLVDISKESELKRIKFQGKQLSDKQIKLATSVFSAMFAE